MYTYLHAYTDVGISMCVSVGDGLVPARRLKQLSVLPPRWYGESYKQDKNGCWNSFGHGRRNLGDEVRFYDKGSYVLCAIER